MVLAAGSLTIDAAPILCRPDLIIVTEASRRLPGWVPLTATGGSIFDSDFTLGARLLGAVIDVGEASASVFEPRREVVSWAAFLRAVAFLPEAAAPAIGPFSFFAVDALQPVTVVFCEEASARALIPASRHAARALLAVTVALVPEAEATSAEQSWSLVGWALFEGANPVLGLALALTTPEEAALSTGAA